jgi:quercetin dioxygenase-like cupin family protein
MLVQAQDDLPKTAHPHLEGIILQHIKAYKGTKVDDLNIRIFEVQPGTENELHSHAYSHDLYVIQGQGIVRLEGKNERIQQGDVVFIKPEVAHSFANKSAEAFQFLCVDYRIVGEV